MSPEHAPFRYESSSLNSALCLQPRHLTPPRAFDPELDIDPSLRTQTDNSHYAAESQTSHGVSLMDEYAEMDNDDDFLPEYEEIGSSTNHNTTIELSDVTRNKEKTTEAPSRLDCGDGPQSRSHSSPIQHENHSADIVPEIPRTPSHLVQHISTAPSESSSVVEKRPRTKYIVQLCADQRVDSE